MHADTFWTNPQYRIDIVDPDEEDDENAGTLIVGVLQEEARKKGTDLLTVGYVIYQVRFRFSRRKFNLQIYDCLHKHVLPANGCGRVLLLEAAEDQYPSRWQFYSCNLLTPGSESSLSILLRG